MFYPFELERFFAKHEFTSKYLLCCSDPQSYTIRELIDLSEDPAKVREEFESLHLGYTESSGDPELRELVADLLYNGQGSNVNFNQENILIHTGAQEVIFTSCKGILKEGDKVMIQTPCYQSHYELPRSLGCEIIEIPTTINEEGKWDLDFKKIEQNIDESVKMLLINTPHNPTGFHFTLQQQKKLIDIIKPYDTILLADEVNRFSEHKDGLLLPSFAQIYNNCISISVLSKSFSLPGIRLGWAASQNLKLLEALVQCKDYTTITNPAPSEFLAKVALRNKEKILKR
ncbi:PLP-dependent transferase, partial [Neoconidiobolus thromboides FSU 785]